MKHGTPNFALRDWAGVICVLLIAVALVAAAFVTHAGPFILIAILIVLIFGLLRAYRERGRDAEAEEVAKALRTRLHKGEELLVSALGDRRRVKLLATLTDFALMIFTQGLAAEDSGSIVQDDTCVGLTNRRLIAIDRQKRPPGRERGWLERLHLRRRDTSKGKHTLIFETPREGLFLSVRLAVFYLARMNIRTEDGHTFSVGLNSRYWAEQATMLSKEQESNGPT